MMFIPWVAKVIWQPKLKNTANQLNIQKQIINSERRGNDTTENILG